PPPCSPLFPYTTLFRSRYAQLIDGFSVISDHLARLLYERHGVPEERIEVIRMGADARGEFDPARVEPIDGVGASAPAILWPGRRSEEHTSELQSRSDIL